MTKENELVLKVKFQDTYKAIANYIRNGLGIKRNDILRYIEECVKNEISKIDLNKLVKEAIRDEMIYVMRKKYSYDGHSDLRGYVDTAIREEVKAQVSRSVISRIKIETVDGEQSV